MKKPLIITFILLIAAGSFAQEIYAPAGGAGEGLYKKYNISLFRSAEGTWFDLQGDHTPGAAGYINILDWLQGRVAGLRVYRITDCKMAFLRNQPAAIFINEMRVDPSILDALPVNDIALIKVVRSPFAAAGTSGGAIALYTKVGEDEEQKAH